MCFARVGNETWHSQRNWFCCRTYKCCPCVFGNLQSWTTKSSVTLGVLTVRVKAGCLTGGSHRRVRLIRCYLQYIHSRCDLLFAFRLRRLAESGERERVLCETVLWLWCCAHFGLGDHVLFPWPAQGKPRASVVQSRLFLTGAGDRSGFMWMYRIRGRRSTLDMVVVFGVLWLRGRRSEP